jgi:chromosome segregation ATPase
MSQSFWESDVAEQPHPEPQVEPQPQETSAEPGALALSANDFSALEERILRTVELVKRERQARAAAEERASNAEAQLHEKLPLIEQLQKELHGLKAEREHVRLRVERLLTQLDALEL